MGKSRFYLGDVGNGAAMKLVVNMIMGSMMASFSEGLVLSKKVGLGMLKVSTSYYRFIIFLSLVKQKSSHRTSDGFIDQSRGTNCGPALMFATKFDETNVSVSPSVPRSGQNQVESEISNVDTFKEMDNHRGLTNKALPLPVPLQQTMFSPGGSSSAAVPLPPRLTPDTEKRTSQPQSQLWQSRSCTADSTVASDKLKDQELAIESGTISVSSVYSQGLLNTLTQALQSSGVDLSHASISVQIDFGNRANSALDPPSTSIVKTDDIPSDNQMMPRSSTGGESDQAFKRLKTGRS